MERYLSYKLYIRLVDLGTAEGHENCCGAFSDYTSYFLARATVL
jgi:hypothetical protein